MFEINEHYETLETFKRNAKRGISVISFGDESMTSIRLVITLANYILYKYHIKDENGYKVGVNVVREISKDELFVAIVCLGYYLSKNDTANALIYAYKIQQLGKIDTLKYSSDITVLKGMTKFERLDLNRLCQ